MKLDAKTIADLELPAGKSDAIFFDRDLPGFGIRLRGSGDRVRRTWIAQYRAQGRTRRVLVGTPEKVTVTDARSAAKKILAAVELGGDPQDAKAVKRQQSARTVRVLVSAYLEARRLELRPVSFRITNLYLTGPYFRSLHPLAITAVGRSDVAACVRAISRTHSIPTAAAARRALSAFFAWVIAEGEMGDAPNPVQGSHRPADPTARDRVLSDAELVAIWRACEDDEHGRITRLLILLGSRRQEIGGMRWTELDLDACAWTLPAERSKNNRPHTVALPPVALAIIRSVLRSARDHLFGDRAATGFSLWSLGKQRLDQRLADAVKPWRLHDIRRTVATRMADIGVEPHIIEACLNHYSGHRHGIAGVYNRSTYDRAVTAALARWSEHVLALVEGRKGNVMALQRA